LHGMARSVEGGVEPLKIERITVDEALHCNYNYAMYHTYSRAYLGKNTEAIEKKQLLDAVFFDDRGEVRIFGDKIMKAVRLTPELGDTYMDAQYAIANPSWGSKLTMRHYLDYDEDGQCFIQTTCLINWTGGDGDE